MDNRANTGSLDSGLIDTSENYEVEHWANKYGISPEQLKAAVKAVGNSAAAVEQYLKK